jgi:hypothetical protein
MLGLFPLIEAPPGGSIAFLAVLQVDEPELMHPAPHSAVALPPSPLVHVAYLSPIPVVPERQLSPVTV